MPQAFDNCIKAGGRVRRVSGPSKRHGLANGEWVNFCFKGGKSYRGHVHKKKF